VGAVCRWTIKTEKTPDVAKTFKFEELHGMVYNMCLHRHHEQVHACLKGAIERIYGTQHAHWYFERLNDIALFYNRTCTSKGLPTFTVMYAEYRPKPDEFGTPPPTP
jgi:hypothetical protein